MTYRLPCRIRVSFLLSGILFLANTGFGQAIKFRHLTSDDGLSYNQINAITQDAQGFIWIGTYDGLNRYDGYRFTVYRHDPDDTTSLSNNWVESLYVDRSGTLWIGTWSGLSRYDKRTDSFIRYTEDSQGRPIDVVTTFIEDDDGLLWMGTHQGLLQYDPSADTFTRYTHAPDDPTSLSNDQVRSLFIDRQGTLWVGTGSPWESQPNEGGLNRFDPQRGTFTRFLHAPDDARTLSNNWVRVIYEDWTGTMWVGTWGEGLHRFDRERGSFTRMHTHPQTPVRIHALYAAILQKDRGFAAPDPQYGVTFIHEDHTGILWMGLFNAGLIRYDRVSGTLTHFQHDPTNPYSLNSNAVWTMFEDRMGTLWIGTRDGLNKLAPTVSAFKHVSHDPDDPTSLSSANVRSFYETAHGVLWVGTDQGLNRLDPDTDRFTHYRHDPDDPTSLSDDFVSVIHEDDDGVLWVGTDRGLNRMDPDTGTFTRYRPNLKDPTSLADDYVSVIHEDGAGRLLIGTNWGMDRLDPDTGIFTHFPPDPNDPFTVSNQYVKAIHEDATGKLWIGTNAGLDRSDPATGAFTNYGNDPSNPATLSNDLINTIHEDPSGSIWIGTSNGLDRLDPATGAFTHYTVKEGLPNNTIVGILNDDEGTLWISTEKGLVHLNPRTNQLRTYDVADGLPTDQFNTGAYFKSPGGTLHFGSTNGFISFRPEEIVEDSQPTPIVITNFTKGNQSYASSQLIWNMDNVVLSHRDRLFTLSFATLDFATPEKNRYAYRLEGLSDEWVDLGPSNSYTFTGLRPGRYTFTVRGSNSRGIWNEKGASVDIRIMPPFWATWWFRMLGILLLFGLVATGIRVRFRAIKTRNQHLQQENTARKRLIDELEAKNAELERFTYTVSHDLKSPLVTIKGFLELLEMDVDQGNIDRIARDIQQINMAADTMFSLLNELLDLSRIGHQVDLTEPVALTDVACDAVRLLKSHLETHNVTVDIAPDMPVVAGDRTRLREVFQNLIENAAKFMGDQPEPHIDVGARLQGEVALCHVQDNGEGIDPLYHEKIFDLFERLDATRDGTGVGLTLVRRIVDVHGGHIWVESSGMGRGSTFFFSLPIHPATLRQEKPSPPNTASKTGTAV